MEPDLEEATHSREELSRFLAKVDEVGKQTYIELTNEDIVPQTLTESLVSDLRTSSEPVDTEKALQKADEYLGKLEKETEERVIHNRTVINTGIDQQSPETASESSGDSSVSCSTLSSRLVVYIPALAAIVTCISYATYTG